MFDQYNYGKSYDGQKMVDTAVIRTIPKFDYEHYDYRESPEFKAYCIKVMGAMKAICKEQGYCTMPGIKRRIGDDRWLMDAVNAASSSFDRKFGLVDRYYYVNRRVLTDKDILPEHCQPRKKDGDKPGRGIGIAVIGKEKQK